MEMKSIFRTDKTDHTKEYMFFGREPNVARYDTMRYPRFDSFVEQQNGFFWQPTEIDISKDRSDYNNMEPHEQHIFISNIKYQTMLDSVQGRGPELVLLPYCSLPELENWLITWGFFETIHSRSYTHIIRNVINDPSEVFDNMLEVQEIIDRAQAVTEAYDKLYATIQSPTDYTDRQRKEYMIECLIAVYALEAVRFYASFATTFNFAKRGIMEGQGKIVKLIARDEFLHQGSTHYMLTRYLGGLDDPEMTEIIHSKIGYIHQVMREVCEQEMKWTEYLFQYGSVVGLNEKILKNYLMWLTDQRTKDLLMPMIQGQRKDYGYRPIFDVKENPIPWINEFLESHNTQVAPQESEISSYIVGGVDSNMSDDDLDELEL